MLTSGGFPVVARAGHGGRCHRSLAGFVDSHFSPRDVFLPDLISNRLVGCPSFWSVIRAFVVQVQADCGIADLNTFHSVIHHALTHFTVEPTVLHLFVKAVDGDDIFLPCRAVGAVPCRLGGRQLIQPFCLPAPGSQLE